MHIKITKMPTCQHVNIRVSKNSYEVKYFRLTDFESCRRGWSQADSKKPSTRPDRSFCTPLIVSQKFTKK